MNTPSTGSPVTQAAMPVRLSIQSIDAAVAIACPVSLSAKASPAPSSAQLALRNPNSPARRTSPA
jgi:hypothetical protein